ncbi:outer membrane beta-barrel protein [Adhaeribacter terreus]|uniref:Outer membrane beta-barrel protein n=1 Tax=Adhaeribacter terreus TaxID=529703 RepID=A0ABW0E6U1_9BACT
MQNSLPPSLPQLKSINFGRFTVQKNKAMKTKLLALALSLSSFQALAQIEEIYERSTITIRSGISVPKGAFGDKSNAGEKAGFAEQGYHIAAEYNGFIDNYFGLGLTFGIRRNPFDIEAYSEQKAPVKYYIHTNWRTNYLLANAIFKYPLAPVLAIYMKVGAGASFNTHPDINSTESKKTLPEFLSKTQGFAYGIGSGIKWQGKKIGTNFEVYSLYTSAKFWHNNVTTKKDLDAINYSFGLSYKLK